MKLGILVVYLVADDNERLLEIHLSQIEKTTRVPFCIYAAANRLLPRFRERIERLSYVKICPIPDTDIRGLDEHPYYLERLAKDAVSDGATHICTFHVDSFPVRAGWAEEISAKLVGDCVLAGIQRDKETDKKPASEFMMFTREFYLAHHPNFRIPEHLIASDEYQRYAAACPHTPDSGVGYGFAIWLAHLSWLPLLRVDKGKNRFYCGGLYGDLIFHLGGAVRYHEGPQKVTGAQIHTASLLSIVRSAALRIIPWRLRTRVLYMLGLVDWVEAHFTVPALQATRAALLADPEGFLRRLQEHR
jgi:hypothetical protein